MADSDDKELDRIVSIWEKAVDTQMHFNEMSVKSRQFGLTFVAAALGLGIVLLTRGQEFSLHVAICSGFEVHATVLIVLSSALALFAVRVLDLNVYHKMLRGAVTFGEDFELNYMRKIFVLQKGMTQAISHFSRFTDAKVETIDGKYNYIGSEGQNASKKIARFYNITISILIISAALLFVMTARFGEKDVALRNFPPNQTQAK